MLPDIQLDNENYDEIMETAKNMIVSMYPEWTDFNYHDPGVTMLELFAWVKESQQYFINKIGPENRKKYLKLLGVARQTKQPARADVEISCGEDTIVACGTKFYAGDICFEADKRTYITSSRLKCCIAKRDDSARVFEENELYFGVNFYINPFSEKPSSDECFYIGLDNPLPKNERVELLFKIGDEDEVKRNPIDNPQEFVPLVDMTAEYFDGNSWVELDEIEDETFGFITSGRMAICLSKNMEKTEVQGKNLYFLRFRITGGEYDTLPIISSISIGFARLVQRDTKAENFDFLPSEEYAVETELAVTGDSYVFVKGKDGLFQQINDFVKKIDIERGCAIYTEIPTQDVVSVRIVNMLSEFYLHNAAGYGTGLPFQQYDIGSEQVEYESFKIMTELPDSNGKYAEWTKVSDFARSSAHDFHYIFNSDEGVVKFGDCIRGMAPEGNILIIGYAVTLGAEGNVTPSKINRIGLHKSDETLVTNKESAFGGKNEETMDSCYFRAHRLLETTDTIVTDEDCEKKVAQTPGLKIEKCQIVKANQAFADSRSAEINTMIVVKPFSHNGRGVPNERYRENIRRYIEKSRLLGTSITVVQPEYADITVYADISTVINYSNAREIIDNTVKEFFLSLKDCFGAEISYSKLYGSLDRLDCVASVNTLTVETYGSGVTRTREGNLILAPNVSAVLTDTEYMINVAY